MEKGKRKIKKSYVPDTLTKSQKQKQIKSIKEKTDRPKLDIKTRRSKWTIKAEKYFGKGKTSVDDIAKRLKVPKKGLEEIIQKGKAAYYNSGSRPNQTAFSWSQARLYSVLFGGASRAIDRAIVEKYKIPLLK